MRRKHPEALSSRVRLAERDIRDLIFGFEGMTNAFRDVVASGKVLRKNRRFFYSSPTGESIFLDSSMVEHSAVNRVVVGSSPTRGAKEQRSCSSIGIWKGKEAIRLRGQAVKTSPFHGGNTGSIPVGVIKNVLTNRYQDDIITKQS